LGIDSRELFAPQPRGIGKTLRVLIEQIALLVRDWTFTLFTNRLDGKNVSLPGQPKLIDIRGNRYNLWENIRLPLAALTERIDLLHCPAQTAPVFSPYPVVLTVHDIIPLRIDDGWPSSDVARFRHHLARSVSKASRIITISDFTRRDLLTEFKIDEKKVDVIHWGIDRGAYQADTSEQWQGISARWDLRRPFFLAFGGDAPRKNVAKILEAFATIVRCCRSDVQLALVGVPKSTETKYRAIIDHFEIKERTVLMGFLSDPEIVALLTRGEALVYPSLYEGFGLPILEAMAAGTPVITSNTTSLSEIAGQAAILVDPNNVSALAEAMRHCLDNAQVKDRLRKLGYRRVEEFSWQRTALQTVTAYKKALGIVRP
jgi:glycosyltransferase involved in cell wall biosynthesis